MYTNRELITLPFPDETRTRAIIFDYGYRPGRPHVRARRPRPYHYPSSHAGLVEAVMWI